VEIRNLLLVGTGGFFGSMARYFVSVGFPRLLPGGGTHYGTFAVNFTGSVLLAVLITWTASRANVPDAVLLVVGTGFFGAYTTFSTFANETVQLVATDGWATAIGYWVLTNVVCLLGVLLGLWIAHQL
jgi:fluoride exporter